MPRTTKESRFRDLPVKGRQDITELAELGEEPSTELAKYEPEPWQRRTGEPEGSYELFLHYWRLGPGRRLADVAEYSHRTYSTIKNLARRHEWSERCEELDAQEQARYLERTVEIRRQVSEDLFQTFRKLSGKFLERIETLTDADLRTWNGRDLAQVGTSLSQIAKVLVPLGMTDQDAGIGNTFNGPVQINLNDQDQLRDARAQLKPYADLFRALPQAEEPAEVIDEEATET